jgi:adenylyltransferase/sulfurtransferase
MERYTRQLLVKGIGTAGQTRLQQSRVLLVGCGGLGTNIANILVRAGVGFIRIIDKDIVEISNLQRQSLYNEEDVRESLPKAVAAYRTLKSVNSGIEVDVVAEELNAGNIDKYIDNIDIVMDGTDNFETRFLLNQICVKNKIPWIHGGVVATSGVVKSFLPGEGPCLECIYPQLPDSKRLPTTKTAGILGTLTSMIGAVQSNEALKYLTGNQNRIMKGMLYIDLWNNTYEEIKITKRTDCECCGKGNYSRLQNP